MLTITHQTAISHAITSLPGTSKDVLGCKTNLGVSQDISAVGLFLKSDSEEAQSLRHFRAAKKCDAF